MQYGTLNCWGEMNPLILGSCILLCDKVPVTASVFRGHKLISVYDKRKFINNKKQSGMCIYRQNTTIFISSIIGYLLH